MWEDVGVFTGADHSHGGHGAAGLQVAEVEASAVKRGERWWCKMWWCAAMQSQMYS